MPAYQKQIKIQGKTKAEIYSRVAQEIDTFLSRSSIGKYSLKKNETEHSFEIESKVFSAVLKCEEGGVQISGNLSFVALPFKSKLDEGIEKWVRKSFG